MKINEVISDEEIFTRVEDGENYQEIADEVGCHRKTIGRHYRAYCKELKENTPSNKGYEYEINFGREQTIYNKIAGFFKTLNPFS